jgi:hypothetical protein
MHNLQVLADDFRPSKTGAERPVAGATTEAPQGALGFADADEKSEPHAPRVVVDVSSAFLGWMQTKEAKDDAHHDHTEFWRGRSGHCSQGS